MHSNVELASLDLEIDRNMFHGSQAMFYFIRERDRFMELFSDRHKDERPHIIIKHPHETVVLMPTEDSFRIRPFSDEEAAGRTLGSLITEIKPEVIVFPLEGNILNILPEGSREVPDHPPAYHGQRHFQLPSGEVIEVINSSTQ
jgi:hypothetical protein